MHPNAALLERLFTSLQHYDAKAMADCYNGDATFRDIAFDLHGKKQIHAMWGMICEPRKLKATFKVVQADDNTGRVSLIDDYVFSSTKLLVHNEIDSRFRFRNGLIVEHHDYCDERKWATMAMGPGIKGWLAGHLRIVRSLAARKKLRAFIKAHPEFKPN